MLKEKKNEARRDKSNDHVHTGLNLENLFRHKNDTPLLFVFKMYEHSFSTKGEEVKGGFPPGTRRLYLTVSQRPHWASSSAGKATNLRNQHRNTKHNSKNIQSNSTPPSISDSQ